MSPTGDMGSLDAQLAEATALLPDLGAALAHPSEFSALASAIYADIRGLGRDSTLVVASAIPIPIEDYLDEMAAFQAWTHIAHANSDNPVVVRAHVMTELYVAFVWLRDSVLAPVAKAVLPISTTARLIDYFKEGDRRRLRNAIAHGRWRYGDDFTYLECWDGQPPEIFRVDASRLRALQTLSRGLAISALLALHEA